MPRLLKGINRHRRLTQGLTPPHDRCTNFRSPYRDQVRAGCRRGASQ